MLKPGEPSGLDFKMFDFSPINKRSAGILPRPGGINTGIKKKIMVIRIRVRILILPHIQVTGNGEWSIVLIPL